jgi:hypothetical protein
MGSHNILGSLEDGTFVLNLEHFGEIVRFGGRAKERFVVPLCAL